MRFQNSLLLHTEHTADETKLDFPLSVTPEHQRNQVHQGIFVATNHLFTPHTMSVAASDKEITMLISSAVHQSRRY